MGEEYVKSTEITAFPNIIFSIFFLVWPPHMEYTMEGNERKKNYQLASFKLQQFTYFFKADSAFDKDNGRIV